jgi:multidrug resistance efflux pump
LLDNPSSFYQIISETAKAIWQASRQEVAISLVSRSASFQAATEIAPEVLSAAAPGNTKCTIVKRAALVLAPTATAGYFGHDYFTVGRYLETTDDAYLKADSTILAPKVSGDIGQVLVSGNEGVWSGQLLAKIDQRDYKAALNQAHADVGAAGATVLNLDVQIELQQPLIRQQAAAGVMHTELSSEKTLERPCFFESPRPLPAKSDKAWWLQERLAADPAPRKRSRMLNLNAC